MKELSKTWGIYYRATAELSQIIQVNNFDSSRLIPAVGGDCDLGKARTIVAIFQATQALTRNLKEGQTRAELVQAAKTDIGT